jgi:3-oxoacid CoA-transferase A subunit
MINKVVASFDEAVRDLNDGAMLFLGGFALFAECPSYLIAAVARKGVRNLTIVGNNPGHGQTFLERLKTKMSPLLKFPDDFYDPGLLVERNQVRKGIIAFPAAIGRAYTPLELKVMAGEIELETVAQGTLAERIRAGRAGIAGFYTPVGVGTFCEQGKEVREFGGRKHLLETAIKADFALIRAFKADRYGNLIYRGSARTFNATMAGAATVTVAEVDQVVEPGELDPECIVTPGVYVQRVVARPRAPIPWSEPS